MTCRLLLLTSSALALLLPGMPSAAQTQTSAGTADHENMPAKAPIPPSHSINITFEGRITTLSVEQLLALPQVTLHVHNAHTNAEETYSGPLLADVLAKAGLTSTRETQPLVLHSGIVATGTDHYFVLYSVAEVEPAFSTGKVIVAVMKSGLPDANGGNIQLINTTDAKPARWLHGLSDLNVISIKPSS